MKLLLRLPTYWQRRHWVVPGKYDKQVSEFWRKHDPILYLCCLDLIYYLIDTLNLLDLDLLAR